jgi:hypothetical protein
MTTLPWKQNRLLYHRLLLVTEYRTTIKCVLPVKLVSTKSISRACVGAYSYFPEDTTRVILFRERSFTYYWEVIKTIATNIFEQIAILFLGAHFKWPYFCSCNILIYWALTYEWWTLNTEYGARGSVVGWGTMLQAGRSRVRFTMCSLDFSIDIILPDDLASNRNEYQESSWG